MATGSAYTTCGWSRFGNHPVGILGAQDVAEKADQWPGISPLTEVAEYSTWQQAFVVSASSEFLSTGRLLSKVGEFESVSVHA